MTGVLNVYAGPGINLCRPCLSGAVSRNRCFYSRNLSLPCVPVTTLSDVKHAAIVVGMNWPWSVESVHILSQSYILGFVRKLYKKDLLSSDVFRVARSVCRFYLPSPPVINIIWARTLVYMNIFTVQTHKFEKLKNAFVIKVIAKYSIKCFPSNCHIWTINVSDIQFIREQINILSIDTITQMCKNV